MNNDNEYKKSILTKCQKRKITLNNQKYDGEDVDLIIELRYDDECNNGHNSFSITGSLYKTGKRSDKFLITCGCIHEIIKKLAPEYSKYIKWHLMSSDEPLHYVANTIYWATKQDEHTNFVYLKDNEFNFKELIGIYKDEQIIPLKIKYGEDNIIVEVKRSEYNRDANLENARSSAICPDATLEQLQNKEWLLARLPKLREDFIIAMEELGFTY